MQKKEQRHIGQKYDERIRMRSPQKPQDLPEKSAGNGKTAGRKMRLFNTILCLEHLGATTDLYTHGQWVDNYYAF